MKNNSITILLLYITFIGITNAFDNLNGNNYLIETIDIISNGGVFNFSSNYGKIGNNICFSGVGGGFKVWKFSSSLGNSSIIILNLENVYGYEDGNYISTCQSLEKTSALYVKPNQLKNEQFYHFIHDPHYSPCFNIYIKNCDQRNNQTTNDIISYEIEIYKISAPLDINHPTIPSFHVFFTIFFVLFFGISIFHLIILKQNKKSGDIIIMFLFIITFSIIGHSFFLSNWSYQLKNMVELNERILYGNISIYISNALFSILIINISQGWKLISNYGTWSGMVINSGIFITNVVLGITAFLIEANDEVYNGEYRNPIHSRIGYVILVLHCLIVFYFIFSSKIFSNMNSSDPYQQSFLFKFKIIFSIWIMSFPILEIISIFVENNFFRFSLFSIIEDSFNLIFYLLIIYIYHPCTNNTLVKRLDSYYDDKQQSMEKGNQNQEKTIDEINLDNLYNK
ncbi:hypothetical protein ACTA71_006228 [Dictyostelium dimigraforme]